MGQRLAPPEVGTQRSEAAWHDVKGLRITGQAAQGAASEGREAQRSAAAGHVAQRSTGDGEAGARDVRSSRKKSGSLAGSGHIVSSRRAARSFEVAGLMVGRLAAGWFTAGLLAVVQRPEMVLAVTGQAEDITTAHTHRTEGDGGGERRMTGIAEGSQAVVGRAVVARHSEVWKAGCGRMERSECLRFHCSPRLAPSLIYP